MCGIAGCYQQADGHKLVDIMSERIAHRGPDANGTWNHEDERVSVQLGHRRLSIIDLSAAADQPLSKHGLTLVYNGELYNYRELKAELASRGVSFLTTQIPRSCSRPGGAGGPRPCAGSVACSRSRWPTRRAVISSWRVTRSASSRSTTSREAREWSSPRS